MSLTKFLTCIAIAAVCGLLSAVEAHADSISFSFDTSRLVGAGPVVFDLHLVDGDGANTSFTVDLLYFGGGHPLGSPVYTGGASGSLSTTLELTDAEFFNSLLQPFSPGSRLSFRLDVSTASGGLPQPDGIEFAILGRNGARLATSDPTGLDALIFAEPTAGGTHAQSFALIGAVPEPATWTLVTLGGAAAVRRRRRTRRTV